MRRKTTPWMSLAIVAIATTFLTLVAAPATAQVKIRFQTWHWGETPG